MFSIKVSRGMITLSQDAKIRYDKMKDGISNGCESTDEMVRADTSIKRQIVKRLIRLNEADEVNREVTTKTRRYM